MTKAKESIDLSFWEDKPDDFLVELPRDFWQKRGFGTPGDTRLNLLDYKGDKLRDMSPQRRRFVRLGQLRKLAIKLASPPKEKKKSYIHFDRDQFRRWTGINIKGNGLINLTDLMEITKKSHGSIMQIMAIKKGHVRKLDSKGTELI